MPVRPATRARAAELSPVAIAVTPATPQTVPMLILTFAALLALVGLLVYAFATNGSLKTIGLACFTAGLAAALVLAAGGSPVRLR